jgi:hypothetical protein
MSQKKTLQVERRYFYPKGESGTDEGGIALFVNGFCVKMYGDYYHDKGSEKIEGFLDCLKSLGYKLKERQTSYDGGEYGDEIPDYKIVPLHTILNKHTS